jgi:hypothetical protein
MPKVITIEAKTKSGERGFVKKEYPLSLQEAVTMFGELEVFKGFLRDRVIIDQREARPASEAGNGEDTKPKKRLSVFDRLNQS